MKNITIGPILFCWKANEILDFYYKISDREEISSVYLGEIICETRKNFLGKNLDKILQRLTDSKKEIIFSTPILVNDEESRTLLGETVARAGDEFALEINDLSALALLTEKPRKNKLIAGPFLNIYSEDTLKFFQEKNFNRVCLPFELPKKSIFALAEKNLMEIEIMIFGRVPLAISARCFHAKLHNLPRDECKLVCLNDPNGLSVQSLDGQGFLAINGTQTLSHSYNNLIKNIPEMSRQGVKYFRISPHNSVNLDQLFDAVKNFSAQGFAGELAGNFASEDIKFSNGFYFETDGCELVEIKGETEL